MDRTVYTDLKFDASLQTHPALQKALALEGGETNLDVAEVFASAAWSLITEPGDLFAGFLRQQLGAAEALAGLVRADSTAQWVARLREVSKVRADSSVFASFESSNGELFSSIELLLGDSLPRWQPRLSLARTIEILDIAESVNAKLISPRSRHWPSGIGDLGAGAPALFWLRGQVAALEACARSVALVGSRVASPYGVEATNMLVQGLAEAEISVVSGGAFGIDAAAHRACLALEVPTVAVMAGGIERLYPSSNEQLFERMLATDAIISEVAPGVAPTKWRFLQRNRLIAALSNATCVVEAGHRSGSINTANHALELGRSVGAVPGSIFSAGSAGTHRLINERGARAITRARDLVDLVNTFDARSVQDDSQLSTNGAIELLPIEKRVYDAIGLGRADVEQICKDAGLTRHEALLGLNALQKQHLVSPKGEYWARA